MKITNLIAVSLAAALAGCAAHQKAAERSSTQAQPQTEVAGANALEAGEPTVRDALLREIPEVKPVYFDYNSDALSETSRATLKANAAWLKEHPDLKVQVAGHCDERGTVEYNLALGQRRAAAVRKYYLLLGVPGSRVATISYGKEQPVCREQNEACWSRNRRAQTLEARTAAIGKR